MKLTDIPSILDVELSEQILNIATSYNKLVPIMETFEEWIDKIDNKTDREILLNMVVNFRALGVISEKFTDSALKFVNTQSSEANSDSNTTVTYVHNNDKTLQ